MAVERKNFMDLFRKMKLWRGIGHIIDTKLGSSLSQTIGQPVNWMTSLIVSRDIDDIPWTPFKKPLTESCLAIVSTAGLYLEKDDPFDVDSARGDASFRTIPSNFDKESLRIAHTHYSHSRVKEDINVLFPVDHLLELVQANVIGKLATSIYSFGFGGDLTQEYINGPDGSAHLLVQKLKEDEVDYVIMVPA